MTPKCRCRLKVMNNGNIARKSAFVYDTVWQTLFWEVGVTKRMNARNVIIINGVSAGNVINHFKRKRWKALFRKWCDVGF